MYNLFFNLIQSQLFGNANAISFLAFDIGVSGQVMTFDVYLCILLAVICTIIVYVACCLLVVKVIKLFGRLWTRF